MLPLLGGSEDLPSPSNIFWPHPQLEGPERRLAPTSDSCAQRYKNRGNTLVLEHLCPHQGFCLRLEGRYRDFSFCHLHTPSLAQLRIADHETRPGALFTLQQSIWASVTESGTGSNGLLGSQSRSQGS